MANPPRVVSPAKATEEFAARRQGYRSQRDLQREGETRARSQDDARRRAIILYTDTISFYRENVGASGDADYTMRQATPTATATWGEITLDAYMGAAGRVIGGRLWSNEARTAGTATLQVQITDGGVVSNYLLPACVLDATNTQTIAQLLPFANGIPFSQGATLRAEVQTAGTFTPNTADMAAELLVVYEGLA